MRIGKITQTAWQRFVRRRLHTGKKDALFEASPWETCSALPPETGERYVWADVHITGDSPRAGYYAVYHAAGELASHGVCAMGASVYVLLPAGSGEDMLGGLAAEADRACEELDIQMAGFQGEVSGAVMHTVVSVSAAGMLRDRAPEKQSRRPDRGKEQEDREIILCGYAGLEGTLRILSEAREDLEKRFVSAFLDQTRKLESELTSPKQILEVYKCDGEAAVRQIGSGGILAALWAISETERTGFEIELPRIALKQETVEICETYRLNPYLMTSAGSYLILTTEAEEVLGRLEGAGARAFRLGAARHQNARVIRNGAEVRYLDRPAPDELERWRSESSSMAAGGEEDE